MLNKNKEYNTDILKIGCDKGRSVTNEIGYRYNISTLQFVTKTKMQE